MKSIAFAVPGDLATPTGGYAYDRRIVAELQQLGWQVDVVDLGEGYPRVSPLKKASALARLSSLPDARPIVIDGLALGVLPDAAAALRARHRLIALVHHPLAAETGLAPGEAEAFYASERAALAAAHRVVVTSPATGRLLIADYEVPLERVTVVPPGTDRAVPASGSSDRIVRLVSVGALVPRKGFDVLIEALAQVADLPWRLAIAGDRSRDPKTAERLDTDIARLNLGERVSVLGALPPGRIGGLYAGADLFVLASRFEGYGMAFAEAIAHGLPVIGTTGGAIPETVPEEAGILVAPDDVEALAQALRLLIENGDARRRYAAGARAAAAALPTWQDVGRLFAAAVESAA